MREDWRDVIKPWTIIFEGGECTGKSTLVQKLGEAWSCDYQKRVATKDQATLIRTVFNDLAEAKQRTSGCEDAKPMLFDRWQGISDIIYTDLFTEGYSILEDLQELIAEECRKAKIMIVYLHCDDDTLRNRFVARGDLLVDLTEALNISNAYTNYFGYDCPFTYRGIDTNNKSPEAVLEEVAELILHEMEEN